MIARPLYSDDFVGRRRELAFLCDEFRAACESCMRCVAIEGEAGIGKSRLIQEFFKTLGESAVIAAGYCSEHVRAPYLPFTEIVDRLDPRARLAALRPREHSSQSEEKWAYFNAVAGVVRAQSAKHPVVLAIEDAQWADNATAELLRFLITRLREVRVLIVITFREELPARNAAAAALRSAVSRMRGATVQLPALRRHEVKHLLQDAIAKRGAYLPPATIAQIEMLAEGNPLFAEELASVALQSGTLSFQAHIPVTLQAILSERLAAFSAAERGLLCRAALVGDVFDASFVCAIAESPQTEFLDVIERAVAAGLVREVDGEAARFAFRHALIRQALADQLVLTLAAPLHVRIAEHVESAPDTRSRAAELAYHWSSAHVHEKARLWSEIAAQSAWDVYAYRDAIRFYTDALRWNYPAGTARAAVYERLGTLLYIDGCGEEPAEWFARARREYEAAGNAVGAAHALLLQADQNWVDARTQESASAALEAAVALKRLGHTPMYAQALLSVARYSVTLGQVDRTLAHLHAASALRAHFDEGSRASWHEVRGETYAVLGDRRRSLSDFRAAARLAAQSGVSELISQIENNFALAAFDLGDLDLAVARHQIAVDEAHRSGLMWRIAYCSLNYARTLMFKGQLQRARALTWDALDAGVTTATFKTKAASVGIPLALLLNDRTLADACADEATLAMAERSGEIQRIASVAAAFAWLRGRQGRADESRALLARAIRAIPNAHRAWDLFIAVARWGDAEDVDLARALLERAPGRPVMRRAYRLLFDALTCGDPARSRRLAAVAEHNFAAMRNVMYRTIALETAGDRQAALTAYREMGAAREVEPLSGPAKPGLHLTPRQLEIAELVACGQTNREIAASLNISEHTVEHHLSGIFERLGLRSRAQLANVLGRQERV